MLYIIISVAVISTAWIGYELYRAPTINENIDDIDDPTTTFWHEDDNP